MIEQCGRLCFAEEASLLILIAKGIRREELQGDHALEARIFGLVDNTHPAFAELGGDLVVGDGLANHAGPILPLRRLLLRTTDVMNYDIFSSPGG